MTRMTVAERADTAETPLALRRWDGETMRGLLAPQLVAMPAWKRLMDVVGALVGLVIALPLMLVIAVAIVVDSRGGPIYRQERVGRGGQTFLCWKFRSMQRGADSMKAALMAQNEATGLLFKMRDDPRRTRVGVFLRKTSLDELPQLWNVLKGEMSLVGPRPPVPSEVALYKVEHLRRLAVVPGITGLWQVTLRGRHDFADMVALDIAYAESLCLRKDVAILVKTVSTVLQGSGSC